MEIATVSIAPRRGTGKRSRDDSTNNSDDNESIPFHHHRGTSDSAEPTAKPPQTLLPEEDRLLDKESAALHLPTKDLRHWTYYEADVASEPGILGRLRQDAAATTVHHDQPTLPEWAQQGFWQRYPWEMLFALAARVPDLSVEAFWCESTAEMALVLKKMRRVFVEVASGESQAKAKFAVAETMIRSADLFCWLSRHYRDTPADRYLKKVPQKAAAAEEPPAHSPTTKTKSTKAITTSSPNAEQSLPVVSENVSCPASRKDRSYLFPNIFDEDD